LANGGGFSKTMGSAGGLSKTRRREAWGRFRSSILNGWGGERGDTVPQTVFKGNQGVGAGFSGGRAPAQGSGRSGAVGPVIAFPVRGISGPESFGRDAALGPRTPGSGRSIPQNRDWKGKRPKRINFRPIPWEGRKSGKRSEGAEGKPGQRVQGFRRIGQLTTRSEPTSRAMGVDRVGNGRIIGRFIANSGAAGRVWPFGRHHSSVGPTPMRTSWMKGLARMERVGPHHSVPLSAFANISACRADGSPRAFRSIDAGSGQLKGMGYTGRVGGVLARWGMFRGPPLGAGGRGGGLHKQLLPPELPRALCSRRHRVHHGRNGWQNSRS